jgi:site-specific recombinase XerC
MESAPLIDCAGRRRSPATLPGYHRGRLPRNKGLRCPPDPPTVEEIIAVMRAAGDGPDGVRLRGVIVVLWRAGVRVTPSGRAGRERSGWGQGRDSRSDTGRAAGAVRFGMDRWAWEALDPWLTLRAGLPIGALFCVLRGPTRGRPCSAAGVRVQLRNAAIAAGVRRRLAPHQLGPAHDVEISREGAAGRDPAAARACRPRGRVRVLAWHR